MARASKLMTQAWLLFAASDAQSMPSLLRTEKSTGGDEPGLTLPKNFKSSMAAASANEIVKSKKNCMASQDPSLAATCSGVSPWAFVMFQLAAQVLISPSGTANIDVNAPCRLSSAS
eukprot:CCRYP_001292-RA/>CCRYP_001292-RA protein AED:0.14 eAED:0.14 QI:1062/0.5/0.66/1/0/0/3/520/116